MHGAWTRVDHGCLYRRSRLSGLVLLGHGGSIRARLQEIRNDTARPRHSLHAASRSVEVCWVLASPGIARGGDGQAG
jgi:hypothetical protein